MPNKHMKRRSTSLIIKNQNHNAVTPHTGQNDYHQMCTIINAGEDVEKRETYYTVGETVNRWSHYGKQYGGSFKSEK